MLLKQKAGSMSLNHRLNYDTKEKKTIGLFGFSYIELLAIHSYRCLSRNN